MELKYKKGDIVVTLTNGGFAYSDVTLGCLGTIKNFSTSRGCWVSLFGYTEPFYFYFSEITLASNMAVALFSKRVNKKLDTVKTVDGINSDKTTG